MRLLIGLLTMCAVSLVGTCHAEAFGQRYAIELNAAAPYYSLALPTSVYMASKRGDLGDVRVFNGANELVPYSLEAPIGVPKSEPVLKSLEWFALPANSKVLPNAPLGVTIAADGSLRAAANATPSATREGDVVDLGHPATRVNALLIHLANSSYQGHVSLAASDDLRNWQDLTEADLLKLSDGGNSLTQERVDIDGVKARYLRLSWRDTPPDIKAVELELQGVAAEATQLPNANPREWRENIPSQLGKTAGEYLFETGGRFPIDRIRLTLPQLNTVAHATLYSRSDAKTAWQEVISAQLYHLRGNTAASEQSNPPIEISPNTDTQWRLVVDMRNGGLGSGLPTLAIGWRPATLTLVARGAAPFSLAVGNARLASAALNRADLIVGGGSAIGNAQVGALLPSIASDQVSGDASTDPDAKRQYVLWAALVVAVAVLGVMAWRLSHSEMPSSHD